MGLDTRLAEKEKALIISSCLLENKQRIKSNIYITEREKKCQNKSGYWKSEQIKQCREGGGMELIFL